jgi:phosphoesterase RecJ-like protein
MAGTLMRLSEALKMAIINNTWEEIADVLKKAEKVLVFTHQKMDGDAVGSSCALVRVLRQLGKEAYVLIEDDELADNLQFLDKGYCTRDEHIMENPDLCVCTDASELSRFPKRSSKFKTGKVTLCIDHHLAKKSFCDYHYVDPQAAAASVLVHHAIRAMGADIDKETASLLFAGITTDTGNFQYSNTNEDAFLTVAELAKAGADINHISVQLYENVSPQKMRLKAMAIENMELLAGGKLAVTAVTQQMLKDCSARMIDAEGIVSELRSIQGAEIAILLKEDVDKIFVSLRAKGDADVQKIAVKFGGGGHVKASGCTLDHVTLKAARDGLVKAAEEAIEAMN